MSGTAPAPVDLAAVWADDRAIDALLAVQVPAGHRADYDDFWAPLSVLLGGSETGGTR